MEERVQKMVQDEKIMDFVRKLPYHETAGMLHNWSCYCYYCIKPPLTLDKAHVQQMKKTICSCNCKRALAIIFFLLVADSLEAEKKIHN